MPLSSAVTHSVFLPHTCISSLLLVAPNTLVLSGANLALAFSDQQNPFTGPHRSMCIWESAPELKGRKKVRFILWDSYFFPGFWFWVAWCPMPRNIIFIQFLHSYQHLGQEGLSILVTSFWPKSNLFLSLVLTLSCYMTLVKLIHLLYFQFVCFQMEVNIFRL